MMTKRRLNAVCMFLAPLFALLSGYLAFRHGYGWALLAILGAVGCMELRVRMGYRGPRKALFASHLALSSAYLFSLALLALAFEREWLAPLLWLSFIGMAASGGFLIRQSWVPRS